MFETLKKYYWIAELLTITAIGFFIGLYINSDNEGIYVKAHWGENLGLTVGKTSANMRDVELDDFDPGEAKMLALKIASLKPNSPLTSELISLKDNYIGPFQPSHLSLRVIVSQDARIEQGNFTTLNTCEPFIAAACRESMTFGNQLTFYELADRDQSDFTPVGSRDFDVLKGKYPYECTGDTSNVVWISENAARNWLTIDTDSPVPNSFMVNAMASKSISIPKNIEE